MLLPKDPSTQWNQWPFRPFAWTPASFLWCLWYFICNSDLFGSSRMMLRYFRSTLWFFFRVLFRIVLGLQRRGRKCDQRLNFGPWQWTSIYCSTQNYILQTRGCCCSSWAPYFRSTYEANLSSFSYCWIRRVILIWTQGLQQWISFFSRVDLGFESSFSWSLWCWLFLSCAILGSSSTGTSHTFCRISSGCGELRRGSWCLDRNCTLTPQFLHLPDKYTNLWYYFLN